MHNWVRSSEESVATLMEDGDCEMLLESADDAADPDEKKWLARQARQKKAQKLYRQKQKERLLELEDEVEKLAQLSQGARSERAALLERNLKLKDRSSTLSALVAAKEAEAAAVREQLSRAPLSRAQSTGSAPLPGTPAIMPPPLAPLRPLFQPQVEVDEAPREPRPDVETAWRELCGSIAALRAFVEDHDLPCTPDADELDEGLLQRLEGLIVACRMQRDAYDGALAATSVAAAVGDGSDPATVIQQMAQDVGDAAAVAAGQGGPQRSGSPTSTAAREARDVQPDWDRILTELALDDRQLHYLVLLRERHQDRLQSLSAARQALSLEALRFMVPRGQGPPAVGASSEECSVFCARVLALQEKLQQEKRATQETEYVLMHRLLSPVQSAVFMLQAHPAKADAFALASAWQAMVDASGGSLPLTLTCSLPRSSSAPTSRSGVPHTVVPLATGSLPIAA